MNFLVNNAKRFFDFLSGNKRGTLAERWGHWDSKTHLERCGGLNSNWNRVVMFAKPVLPPDWKREPTADNIRPWGGAVEREHQQTRSESTSGLCQVWEQKFSCRWRRTPTAPSNNWRIVGHCK